MQPDMSFTHLISSASLFAQFVLILLVLASIFSWALIFSKRKLLKQLNEDAVAFDEQFWSGGNLADLHEQTRREENLDGVAAIFSAGFEEYTRQQAGGRLNADEAVASPWRVRRFRMASGLPESTAWRREGWMCFTGSSRRR